MSRKTTSKKRVLAYLRIAVRLEEDAIKRYMKQIERIEIPDVNALLEGIRRNEEPHRQILNEETKLLRLMSTDRNI